MIKQIKEEATKVRCLKCRKFKTSSPTHFYANTHPLFSTEKFETCKECIFEYLGDKSTNGYMDKVLLVLSILNKPFILNKWEKCGEDWSKYITQISSLPQTNKMTFSDSDKNISSTINLKPIEINETNNETNYSSDEFKELTTFWGSGIEEDSLIFLQNEYEKFINAYECDSYAMEILFQEASQQRLAIKKLRFENKPVDKELKTLQDLLGSANIKPAQESGSNATEQATFGTLIKKYENERPIPEPEGAWKDVDGIKKYVSIWFLGHFSKMIGIKNEHSNAYDKEMDLFKVEPPKFEEDISDETGEEI